MQTRLGFSGGEESLISRGACIPQNIKQLLKGMKEPAPLSPNGPWCFVQAGIHHDLLFINTFSSLVGACPCFMLMYAFIYSSVIMP